MKKMTPAERVAFIEKKFQIDLAKIKTKLNGHPFELIGTKRKPRGIKIEAHNPTIAPLLKLPFIDKSKTVAINKRATLVKEPYFCFRMVFKIQVEGVKKGIQTIEERFILVKADSLEKAERKVTKNLKAYEKPYLNPYGQLVRWKFESIEESYHTFITHKKEFDEPVEVFSTLKSRRLKKEDIWNGQ